MGIAAGAPSGPVDQELMNSYPLQYSIFANIDALLDLHGAMVTEEFEDGEGELLKDSQARPDTNCDLLDMHANVTKKMISNCDVLTGTIPTHIDMDATAVRSAELFFKMLRGEINPQCTGPMTNAASCHATRY